MIPEVACGYLSTKFLYPWLNNEDYTRHARSSGYALNLILISVANLFGFCVRSFDDGVQVVKQGLGDFVTNCALFGFAFILAQFAL